MVKHTSTPSLRQLSGWTILHQTDKVSLATSRDGIYQLMLVSLTGNQAPFLKHFTDGAITCYLKEYHGTDYLGEGRMGSLVEGYLNFQPIQGYALRVTEGNNYLLLVAGPRGEIRRESLRPRVRTVARQLGLEVNA